MIPSSDGGLAALAGYLYQIVSVIGMRAMASCDDHGVDRPELMSVLTLLPAAVLQHEQFDQDAVLKQVGIDDPGQVVLVQFKYSRVPRRSPLSRNDLINVVTSFARSRTKAVAAGSVPSQYVLITNRTLSRNAREALEDSRLGNPPGGLKGASEREIASTLCVVDDIPEDVWHGGLSQFAHRYGCYDDEIERGIDELIGRIVRATADQRQLSIDENELVSALVGNPDARPLAKPYVLDRIHFDLHHFRSTILMNSEPVRRSLLEKVSQAITSAAIVVLVGPGGNGKTVALWQWMSEAASIEIGSSGPLVRLRHALDVSSDMLAEAARDWGGYPRGHPRSADTNDSALSRLTIANPEIRAPMVCLGIDGLDEVPRTSPQVREIRSLLRFAHEGFRRSALAGEPHHWCLILSCRDEAEVRREWLLRDSWNDDADLATPGIEFISVDVFTDEEVLAVVSQDIPQYLPRFERSVGVTSSVQSSPDVATNFPMTIDAGEVVVQVIDREVLRAIKHPAVLRSLISLHHQSEAKFRSALDGEELGVRGLAAAFVSRCCNKMARRGRPEAIPSDQLLNMLRAIASVTNPSNSPSVPISVWVDAAKDAGGVTPAEARVLLQEAHSGGLTEPEDRYSWRWRYEMVWAYLADEDCLE